MSSGNGTTVLLVENSESLTKALVKILEEQGFKPLAAPDFESAAQLFNAEKPGLVLCELKIGEDNAFAFMNGARSSKTNPGVPIILMSTTKNAGIVTAAAKAGATDFMVKPFSPEVLVDKLEKALTRRAHAPSSSKADKYVAAGRQLIKQKRLQDAMALFAKAAKLDAESAEAFQGLAEVCLIKKDTDQFAKLALKAADIHVSHDNFEAAQDIFLKLRRFDAEAPNPFKLRAQSLAENQDFAGAVRTFQKAALIDPADPDIHTSLSKAYLALDNREQALQSVTTALKLDDELADARKLFRQISGNKWTDHPESEAGRKRTAEDERRGTVRFWVPDLVADVKGRKHHASLIELSVNSIGIAPLDPPAADGELLAMSIVRVEEDQPKTLIKKLKARVVRQDAETVGCRFEDLSEEQRQELHELIKSAQETQRELKREQMLKNGDLNFDIDMLFL